MYELAQSLQDEHIDGKSSFLPLTLNASNNPIAGCHYHVPMPTNADMLERSPGSADACVVVRTCCRSLECACIRIAQSDYLCRRRGIYHSFIHMVRIYLVVVLSFF